MQTPSPPILFKRATSIQYVATALGMHKSTISLGLWGRGNVSKKTRECIMVAAFWPVLLTCATHPKAEIANTVSKLLMKRLNGCLEPPHVTNAAFNQ